jgi:hypothetical protein
MNIIKKDNNLKEWYFILFFPNLFMIQSKNTLNIKKPELSNMMINKGIVSSHGPSYFP